MYGLSKSYHYDFFHSVNDVTVSSTFVLHHHIPSGIWLMLIIAIQSDSRIARTIIRLVFIQLCELE